MRLFKPAWLITPAILLILLGCSGGSGPTTPPASAPEIAGLNGNGLMQTPSRSRYLWGYWAWTLDPGAGTLEAVPLREGTFHVNVLKFLEEGVPNLIIKNLVIGLDSVEVDIELRHPFPGMSQYTGFDVRGIFITPGSVSGYFDSGIVHPAPGESYLVNNDGWTRWWNPTEFPVGDTIFGYIDGDLGNPYTGSNLNSTINAFKYFCDDIDFDDSLDELVPAHRGMFGHGVTNERHYSIHFDQYEGLIFNYAVDASWDLPSPDPPIAVPGDFPPTANAQEAYRVETSIVSNDLFYADPTNKGGHVVFDVNVYDWQGCGYTLVQLQKPDGWTTQNTTPSGGTDQYSTYNFDIGGSTLESSDTFEILIGAESMDYSYEFGDIPGLNLTTYTFISIPVSGTANAPVVTSVDPDNADIGEDLNIVSVYGSNFAGNAEVTLIDDATGTIIIEATGEIVTLGTIIACIIDLSGPTVVPGKYDVRVTNPDTSLFGELDKGFTVNDTDHPWPSWRGGDLNQAASIYVGYGDATASTTPKWTFSAVNQGNAGTIVANDGTIYFTVRNCALYAVNPDGTEKWMFQPQTPWISLCPALDDEGYIYCAMGTPSANYLHKVDPATGTAVWSCYLGSTPCYATAPSIGHDGAIYVTWSTAFSSGFIQRVNPDGTLGWNYWIPSSAYSYSWQLGTAILPNGNIIAAGGTHGKIFCFEPDGDIVWEYQYTNWILHTPSVGPEGNIYFTTWSGGDIVAIDSDGNYLWTYDSGFYIWSSPAVDPITGNIFWGDRLGHFRCFSSTGALLWDHPFAGTGIDGSAAVDSNGDVYIAVGHQPSAPFVGLVKMDGTNGDILWQSDDLGYLVTHSPSIGADGTVYMTGHYAAEALYAWGE